MAFRGVGSLRLSGLIGMMSGKVAGIMRACEVKQKFVWMSLLSGAGGGG